MKRQSVRDKIARVCGLMLLLGLPVGIVAAAGPWKAPEEAKKIANPVKATPESIAKGKTIYYQVCHVCHGEKGDGKGPAGAALNPPLGNFTDKARMDGQTDGELFWKITNGDGGSMASYKNQYSDTDRWNLVNYLRTFCPAPLSKTEQGKLIYTCPMHPQVTADKSGKCSICGMNLVPKKMEPMEQMPMMQPGSTDRAQ